MPLFKTPERLISKSQDKNIVSKSKAKVSNSVIKSKGGVLGRIDEIVAKVETNLGQYRDEYQVIQDQEILHDFITECIGNGYISLDTETDGLDPLLNHIVGICPYTPGQKSAYIPLNHISYITNTPTPGQLDIDFVATEFKRLFDKKPEVDMFNAKFDIRFMRNQARVNNVYATWDGYLGARLLNENEPDNSLKRLHRKYILNDKEDAFKFDELFNGIAFSLIPINTAYLYAAHDPIITFELCEYQRKYLRPDNEREDMRQLYWVMKNIEMPCVEVVADMEDTGILLDKEYAAELSKKYNKLLIDTENKVQECIKKYDKQISEYKAKNPNHKLDDPINIGSPTQLAILLYDVLKIDPVDKKSPRGTGVDILNKIDNPICKAVLEYRGVQKLLSTYIDKLPDCVNPNDGRIHCSFHQYGADTGRMASSDPNLQNIPSHNKDIRKMFVASPGYVLMSSDYSQQEPSCLATFCKQAGSAALFDARFNGDDLYSAVASACFKVPYEQCCEFDKEGNKNPPEYKERRNQAKPVLLGILYGRGDNSVAEQMHISLKEAQQLKVNLFKKFPEIEQFEKDSLKMAEDLGYVTTVCGRKRRLPDLQLPEYEFRWKDGAPPDDDLLDFDDMMNSPEYNTSEVPEDIQDYYWNKLEKAWFKEKQDIKKQALEEGIVIIDNGGKIADATRQCVNSRIQGSAADLTKLAMIELNNNERLKELGFKLLIPVHDEVIAECPEENAKECSKLLAEVMSDAAQEILHMPFSCDVEISKAWYGEEIKL